MEIPNIVGEVVNRCPVCGSSEFITLPEHKYKVLTGFIFHLEYNQCKNCTHRFLSPRVSEEMYGSGEYRRMVSATDVPNISSYWEENNRGRLLIEFIVPLVNNHQILVNKIVDVGGSTGSVAYSLTRALGMKIHPTIVDPNDKFTAPAREVGMPVFRSMKEVTNGPFDLVLCIHTLEHINNPIPFTKELYNLLAPGGTLILEVPHPDSVGASFSIAHPQAFTDKSLKLLLEHCGFEIMVMLGAGRGEGGATDIYTAAKRKYEEIKTSRNTGEEVLPEV